jgi:hypothetical protein
MASSAFAFCRTPRVPAKGERDVDIPSGAYPCINSAALIANGCQGGSVDLDSHWLSEILKYRGMRKTPTGKGYVRNSWISRTGNTCVSCLFSKILQGCHALHRFMVIEQYMLKTSLLLDFSD